MFQSYYAGYVIRTIQKRLHKVWQDVRRLLVQTLVGNQLVYTYVDIATEITPDKGDKHLLGQYDPADLLAIRGQK